MKILLVTSVLLFASLSQAITCVDRWGKQADVRGNPQGIEIRFPHRNHPDSHYMRYVGQRPGSLYFSTVNKRAEVQRTVFTTGQGTIWYRYLVRHWDDTTEQIVTLRCQ